jgi:hypothetical protein
MKTALEGNGSKSCELRVTAFSGVRYTLATPSYAKDSSLGDVLAQLGEYDAFVAWHG